VRLCNHCCAGKTISVAYSESVFVALDIQHAMRTRHIVICGLSSSTLFFHITLQRHKFREKKQSLNIKCVFWFSLQTLSETFLTVRRIERDLIKMFIGLHAKCPLLLWGFNEIEFLDRFWKIHQYQISQKSVQWEPSSFMRRTEDRIHK
jgi:hypothetical protein